MLRLEFAAILACLSLTGTAVLMDSFPFLIASYVSATVMSLDMLAGVHFLVLFSSHRICPVLISVIMLPAGEYLWSIEYPLLLATARELPVVGLPSMVLVLIGSFCMLFEYIGDKVIVNMNINTDRSVRMYRMKSTFFENTLVVMRLAIESSSQSRLIAILYHNSAIIFVKIR